MASRAVGGIRSRNRARYVVQILPDPPQAPTRQSSLTPWRVFGVGTSVLLALLQLHFYDSSPFDTHPTNMWTVVFAGFICCIALEKDTTKSSRSFGNVCVQVGYVSGLLAPVGLISVVVPPSFEPFVFVAWIVIWIMFVNVAFC